MTWFNFFAALFISLSASAQYDGKDPDVASRFRPGFIWHYTGLKPAGKFSGPKYDRFIIDLAYNDWYQKDSGFVPAKPASVGFNFHVMFDIPLAPKNTVGLGIGLSYRHQRISYDGLLIRNEENRSTELRITQPGAESPDKSVFASDAFAIPVELRFRTPRWTHVKLHVGAHVGYRVRNYTKVRMSGGDVEKSNDFFDDERFFYGVHARIGIRNWALFADYSLSPQFSSGKSSQLSPVSFGISCSLF